jgi:hypothetical protein
MIAFTFLYIYLLLAGLDVEHMREKIEKIKQKLGG